MMMNKEIEDIFKKLEDPNFENQTSKDEREFLSLKERSNQNKMKRVRGVIPLTDAHKIERG